MRLPEPCIHSGLMLPIGIFETCRPAVTVSASGGRPEVIGGGPNRRECPNSDLPEASNRCVTIARPLRSSRKAIDDPIEAVAGCRETLVWSCRDA
jgi:hypothetical protein